MREHTKVEGRRSAKGLTDLPMMAKGVGKAADAPAMVIGDSSDKKAWRLRGQGGLPALVKAAWRNVGG